MHVLIHAVFLDMHTTAAGHWDSYNSIVQYTSTTSWVAACVPSERHAISKNMVENFPHVHGK